MSFSPVDLLAMPDIEQQILRCLNKQPSLTISEIAEHTQIPIDELEETLGKMVNESRIVEQMKDGQRTFSVRFSRSASVRNMPSGLLDMFEHPKDKNTFLAEVPLTSRLSPEMREALLAKSRMRKLLPDEVFLRQGKNVAHIGLVHSGLLKVTRLQKGEIERTIGFVRQAEWLGLPEALGELKSLDTVTAVAESKLLLWPVPEFVGFMTNNPHLGLATSQWLSQKLYHSKSERSR